MITQRRVYIAILAVVAFFAVHVRYVTPQNTQYSLTAIYQDVWNKASHQLQTTTWAGAQGANAGYTETEILRDVYDATNHLLRTSGGGASCGGPNCVPETRQVNGHALSSDVTVTKGDVGLGNVDNTSDASKNSATAKLTNHSIAKRKITCTPVANTITPNGDTTDVCEYVSLAATTTIANPTTAGSFDDQQVLEFELSGASAQSITWGNKYVAEYGIPLPIGITGSGTYNRFAFRYSLSSTNWGLIATTKGDDTRTTTLASATTFTPVSDNAEVNEMVMTGGAGTVTIAAPTGTPGNNKKLLLKIMCTVAAQTLAWNGTYIDSAAVVKPTTCPLLSTKWVMVGVLYSTQTSNWQVIASTN